jgi:hypothetical protein
MYLREEEAQDAASAELLNQFQGAENCAHDQRQETGSAEVRIAIPQHPDAS